MRLLASLLVVLMLAPGLAWAQYDDPESDLLNIEPGTVDPNNNLIEIPLGHELDPKRTEAERVTEETLCCRMPDDVREAEDLCKNVECP